MKELKEKLLGKEFEVLDLDNEVQCILKNTSRSLKEEKRILLLTFISAKYIIAQNKEKYKKKKFFKKFLKRC